ncbi:unnamed protein product [Ilex paraguariensis]|uniref:Single-stranded DNA binding protein Ssb-like OB fold domain-containing protein n=1 Tax=Ilex paraguariensis TaxID=185542 RepID=A0ABC8V2A8_9AQUA
MAERKEKQPVFIKVEQLRPATTGLNLIVKVVNAKMILQRGRAEGTQGRQMRLAECLVGDETAMIVFTARNDQVIINHHEPSLGGFKWSPRGALPPSDRGIKSPQGQTGKNSDWLILKVLLQMAERKEKQPVFIKVEQLRPATTGLNLIVKVVNAKMILQRGRAEGTQGRQMRLAECLVGDETAMIVFTARNDQGMFVPPFFL